MEKMFIIKATGNELPSFLDGVSVPYIVADNPDHAAQLATSPEHHTAIFNESWALRSQKAIKSAALDKMEEMGIKKGQTPTAEQKQEIVAHLREIGPKYKPGTIKAPRGTGATSKLKAEVKANLEASFHRSLINSYLDMPAEAQAATKPILVGQGITDEMIEAIRKERTNGAPVATAPAETPATAKPRNGGPKPGREAARK